MNALAGRRIAVTRAPHQADDLARPLRLAGAEPLLYPCIDIASPDDVSPLIDARDAAQSGAFDWIVVTSVNTARALRDAGFGSTHRSCRWAAVGPTTAAALPRWLHVEPAVVPKEHLAKALAASMPLAAGERVLLPQSNAADDSLATLLQARGAVVTSVVAYRTIIGHGGVDLPALLRQSSVDVITLTSGSAIANLLARFQAEGGDPRLLSNVPLACIGSETAAAVRAQALEPTIVAREHSIDGLISAIASYLGTQNVG